MNILIVKAWKLVQGFRFGRARKGEEVSTPLVSNLPSLYLAVEA